MRIHQILERASVKIAPNGGGAWVRTKGVPEPTVILPIEKLDAMEPDAKFDDEENAKNLKAILKAIKRGESLPPILVRRIGRRFQILDGYHRFKAYKSLGMKRIPAQIVDNFRITESAGRSIIAYHGTPHDFSEFDIVKIGTGEGAQVFGHGMYFADSQRIAENYADNLSAKPYMEFKLDPEIIKPELVDLGFSQQAIDLARKILTSSDGDGFQAIDGLTALHMNRGSGLAKEAADVIRAFAKKYSVRKGGGNMYQVEINIPKRDMLFWDAFLHDQSPKVRKAICKILKAEPNAMDIIWKSPNSDDEINLSAMEPDEREITERTLSKSQFGRIAPRWEHKMESLSPEKLALGDNPEKAAATLYNSGIPGIRYLDGFSRGVGEGTSNYVIFDMSRVKIIRKWKR